MITLEVNGSRFEGWTSISAVRSLGAVSGSFSFGVTSDRHISLPIRMGNACRVLIDDNEVVNGFVENVDLSYSATEHAISVQGRDKTMDAIDSSVINLREFSGKVSLQQLIRRVLDAQGLSSISVINNVPGLESFDAGDIQSAEVSETIFAFIERYSQKRQVLLTGDGRGNIVITRSGTSRAITALINAIDGRNNNILAGKSSYSETNLFNRYIAKSQQNPIALNESGETTPAEIADQSGEIRDNNVRSSRVLEIKANQSGSDDDSTKLAKWSRNIRRAKSFTYGATVYGYYQDAAKTRLWVPNERVLVRDDFMGVNSTMLVDTVEYKLDLSSGSTTNITLVEPNVYTLEAEQNEREARANETGLGIL